MCDGGCSTAMPDTVLLVDDSMESTKSTDCTVDATSLSIDALDLRTHEELVRGNHIREFLLSQTDVKYDSAAADRLMAIHAARKTVLGVTWNGARHIFGIFEKISHDMCRDIWNFTVPMEWLQSQNPPAGPESSFTLSTSPAPMWWIVKSIIVPQTISVQESLLFLLFGLTIYSFPIVGAASLFHSYTWGEGCGDTFSTLDEAISSDVDRVGKFIWWDIFCQNQHAVGDVAETFKTAIKQVEKVLFSVPNLSRPQALSRVWCLFELTNALLTPSAELVLVNLSRKQHRKYGDPMKYIVGVADADATYVSDKQMLLSLIEAHIDGGCDAADRSIRELFIPCFVTQCLLDLVIDGQLVEMVALVSEYSMTDLRDIARKDKTTLLHLAAKHGHCDIVSFLLEHNVNVNAQNYLLSSPLHEAARSGHGEICDVLLMHGADVDAVDDDGESALHIAANIEVVKVLLLHNANPTIENLYDEFTPTMSMILNGASPEMIALVVDAESQHCGALSTVDEEGSSSDEDESSSSSDVSRSSCES